MLSIMSPLLPEVWRKQHPKGHKQIAVNFVAQRSDSNQTG